MSSFINHYLSRLNDIICLTSKKSEIPADYYRNCEYHENKPLIVQKYLKFSQICYSVNQSPIFNYFIFGAILVSAILIGLDTYISSDAGSEIVKNLDIFVLSIFFLECFIKICMEGLVPWMYFIGPDYAWNLFDFSIIILAVSLTNVGAILKLLRLARLAKLARYIPSLRMIINGFVVGVASVLPIFLLLIISFYVFGMIGYNLFSVNDPFHFGTLEMSMLTLFRLCVYDNAQDIMYLNTFGCDVYPDLYVNDESLFNSTNSLYWCESPSTNYIIAPIFFILFILIAGFMILSLFVGAVALSMSLSLRELEMTEREKLRKKRFNNNLKRLKIIRFNHDNMYHESGKDWMEIDSTDNDSAIFSIDTSNNSSSDLLDRSSNYSNPATLCYSKFCKIFEPDYTLQMIFLKATLGNSLAVAMGWKDHHNHKTSSSGNQSSQLGGTIHNDLDINSSKDNDSSANSSRNLLGLEKQVLPSSSSVNQKTAGHSPPLHRTKPTKVLLSFSQDTQDAATAPNTNAKSQQSLSERSLYFIEGEILGVVKSRPFYIHYYLLLTIQCHEIVNHSKFALLTVAIISTGLVVAGIATDPYLMSNPRTENAVKVLDSIILAFFIIEILLKIISCGFQPWIYFNSLWNITDTIIVIASFIPASHFLIFIFRILLLQRIVKLVNQFPELVIIVNAIGISFLTVGYIALILFLIFYVFGILGVILFAESDPWHFGQLHTAFVTLFRALILDNVFELIYTNFYGCDVYPGEIYDLYPEDCKNPVAFSWLSVLYHLSFVIVGVFVLLTLFIGVISTSLENAQLTKRNDTKLQLELKRHAKTLCLSPERLEAFRRVFKVLDLDENGMLEEDELHMGLEALCLDISDEIFDDCINRVDPDREGLNQLAFLNFMSMLPSYRKSLEHVLQYSSWFIDSNLKKNRAPDANIFVKISYGIQDLLDKVLGQEPESIIAKQTNAALTIQEFWLEYKKRKKEKQKLRSRRRKSTLNQQNDEESFLNVFRWSNTNQTNRLMTSSNNETLTLAQKIKSENDIKNTENAATFLLQEKFKKALNASNSSDISEQQKPCGLAENEGGHNYHTTTTLSPDAPFTYKNAISQVSQQVTLQSTQFFHHLASPPDRDNDFNYAREAAEIVDNAKQHQHHVNSSNNSSRKENQCHNTNDYNTEQQMNQKIMSNVRLKPLHPTEIKSQANKVYVDNTFASFKKDRCQKSEVDSIVDTINKATGDMHYTDTAADSKNIYRNYVDNKDIDNSQQRSKFRIYAAEAKISSSRNVVGRSAESKMFKQSSSSGI